MIIIAAPHTSNWDFMFFLAAVHAFKIRLSFLAKDGLFRWPFGYFFRALGGIPVTRSRSKGLVEQVVAAFEREDELTLLIAPEGTRSAAPKWKSGFLYIARETNAPVVMASIDASRKEVTLSGALPYTGDPVEFMDSIREFYEGKQGLRPENMGPIRVSEEK